MEFKDIASVSGKGGLFKVLKPTRSGVILESLDSKKAKLVAGINHRVSILHEISIYTNTAEGSVPLEDVMKKINQEFGEDPGVDRSASNEELASFFKFILPDYDADRVYNSDIKKIISWYNVLLKEAPSLFATETTEKKSLDGKEETETKPDSDGQ